MGGPAVDAQGHRALDPTVNVLNTVAAAVQRQDDLRESESRHVREVLALRQDIMALRAEHEKELRDTERMRLDAIREIDVAASVAATTAAQERASTLASQTEAMAEALRQSVSSTAQDSNRELKAALQPLMMAIEELRRWQYESAGQKQQVVETRDVSGLRAVWLGLVGVVLFNVVSIVIGVMAVKG